MPTFFILSAWEKAECYEEVANHSQRIIILIQNNNLLGFSYIYDVTQLNSEKLGLLE